MPYGGSVSEEVAGELKASIDALLRLRNEAITKARTPSDVAAYLDRMRATVKRSVALGHNWAKEDLKQVFNDAYAAGGGGTRPRSHTDAAYRERQKSVKAMQRLGRNLNRWVEGQDKAIKLAKAQQTLQEQLRQARDPEKITKINDQLRSIREQGTEGGGLTVTYFAKGHGKSARSAMGARFYVDMATKAAHVTNENMGFVLGVINGKGDEAKLVVHDGSGCGWASHNDPAKADGKVVTAAEARSHLKAHPNCERSFDMGTKENIKEAKARAAEAKALERAARTAARREALQRAAAVAKTAVAVAKAAATAKALYETPGMRILVNNIINNANDFPDPLASVLARFRQYRALENVAAKALKVEPALVRDEVYAWSDDTLSSPTLSEDGLVSVPPGIRDLLGVGNQATPAKIRDAVMRYTDYVVRTADQARDWAEQVQRQGVIGDVTERIMAEDPEYAMRFHLAEPRGTSLGQATRQTAAAFLKAYQQDADYITEDVVGTLARRLDVLPWPKASFGKFRASIGLTAEGREKLAEKLFRSLQSGATWSSHWTAEDRRLAKEMGVALEEAWSKEDIINAVLPRITLNPAGRLGFTVGMEDGTVKPVFRASPLKLFSRYLGMETTTHSGAFARLAEEVTNLREGGVTAQGVRNFLSSLGNETITTIGFLRNGLFGANVKFWGSTLDSWTVRLGNNESVLRLVARFRRFSEAPSRLFTDVHVLPGLEQRIPRILRPDLRKLIAGLHVYFGNLGELAHHLRTSYEDVLSWYGETKAKYGSYFRRLTGAERQSIRSWEDLRRYVRDFTETAESLHNGTLDRSLVTSDLNIHQNILNNPDNKILREDLRDFNNVWSRLFPKRPPPHFAVINNPAGPEIAWSKVSNAIEIRDDVLSRWTELDVIHKKNVRIGLNPRGTDGREGMLWHEAGHYIAGQMTTAQYKRLWDTILKFRDPTLGMGLNQGWTTVGYAEDSFTRMSAAGIWGTHAGIDQFITKWMYSNKITRYKMRRALSGLATKNPAEFLGEIFSEYMTSRNPSALARTIGQMMVEALQ